MKANQILKKPSFTSSNNPRYIINSIDEEKIEIQYVGMVGGIDYPKLTATLKKVKIILGKLPENVEIEMISFYFEW